MPRGVYERKPRPAGIEPGATPPQKRTKKPAASKGPAATAAGFIAAMTADTRLVVIGRSPAPEVYTEQQTEEIATLIANHFEA